MIKVVVRSGDDALNAYESSFKSETIIFKTIWDAIQYVTDETNFTITTDEILDDMNQHGFFYKRQLINFENKWIAISIREA